MSEDQLSFRQKLALIRNGMAEKTTKAKEKKPLKKFSDKKAAETKEWKEGGGISENYEFFKSQRSRMSGKCLFCKGKTQKHDDATFHFSMAHILEKRTNMFPSIATHPEAWIELCYYDNSCHGNYDNKMISLHDIKETMPKAFEIIIGKFLVLYPCLTPEEKARVPDILMQYVPKTPDITI